MAKHTHAKYGKFQNVMARACGYIAIKAHTSVISTNSMSTAANMLFFKPNCSGVKAILKMMFNIKGNATINGIVF